MRNTKEHLLLEIRSTIVDLEFAIAHLNDKVLELESLNQETGNIDSAAVSHPTPDRATHPSYPTPETFQIDESSDSSISAISALTNDHSQRQRGRRNRLKKLRKEARAHARAWYKAQHKKK